MNHQLHGVWAAAVTPLTIDLAIDHDRFARYVRHLLEAGNHGVALFGSTGEGNSFSCAERMEAVRRLADSGLPMNRILVGAGACAFPDSVAMSRAATEVAALGVLLHPPFYYKDLSDEGLLDWFSRVADGVGPSLRVVLYHFPRLIGVGYSPGLIDRLMTGFDDRVIGIKDSSGDFDRMVSLAQTHPGLSVLAGNEKYLLAGLEKGLAGCLTATTNLTAPSARRVYDAFRADLPAKAQTTTVALQNELSIVRSALETAPFISGIKRILADRSGDESWVRVRPPQRPLSAERADELRTAVLPVLGPG